MPSAVLLPPVVRALRGIEQSLRDYGVTVAREVESAALHVLEYHHAGQTLAAVGFTDELKFLGHPEPNVVALIRSHHALAVA
jgi:hypothetical protein